MNIAYCCESCSIGKAASENFLAINNSAFDAAIDFQYFVDNCFKSCPHKAVHLVSEEDSAYAGN